MNQCHGVVNVHKLTAIFLVLVAGVAIFLWNRGSKNSDSTSAESSTDSYTQTVTSSPASAEDSSDPQAIFMTGADYYRNKEFDKAFVCFKKAAKMGHAKSQFNVGTFYYNGTSVTRNYAKAAEYFRLAADQDLPEAQFALGTCYEQGDGVPGNLGKALVLYEKAANNGNSEAQARMKELEVDRR